MQRKGRWILGIVVSVYLVCVIGYYGSGPKVRDNSAKEDGKTVILTSFYPMYMHVKSLTKGADVQVINLTEKQVGCLHDYQLTVKDVQKISQADLLVINGLGNENFMDKAYEQNKDLKVIDASLEIQKKLEEEAHNHHEEHTEHEEHQEHSGHEEHGDHTHAFNEHIWVSAEGSIEQVKMISKELQRLDAANRAIYKENEQEYLMKLEETKSKMHQALHSLKGEYIVTTHSTFDYFAKEFGLDIASVILKNEESMPTPKEVEEIITTMEEKNIGILFTEKQYEYLGIVNTIARESGGKIYYLDSFVSNMGHQDDGSDEYINRMTNNLEVLKKAYGL